MTFSEKRAARRGWDVNLLLDSRGCCGAAVMFDNPEE